MRVFSHLINKQRLLTLILLLVSPPMLAEIKQLPTPLDIETALTYAKDHPRTRLTPEQQFLFPARQPLFLNCHDLTFNNTETVDNHRNGVATNLINPVEQQKLVILQHFFDVLLADASLIGINEDMAGAFIGYDRAKTRMEFKQLSELDVAKLNSEYQKVRQQFFSGDATQRLTRSLLAQAIGRPDDLSSELNPPELIKIPKKLPEPEQIVTNALKNNLWLNTLKENSNKDQISLLNMDLQQQALELTLRLKVLSAAKQRAETEGDRRDLDLELSRTLYEMEVKASLGRSMTLQSMARMDDERISYCQTLAWAQLNTLQGLPILTPPKAAQKEKSE